MGESSEDEKPGEGVNEIEEEKRGEEVKEKNNCQLWQTAAERMQFEELYWRNVEKKWKSS